ncbi:hypothetical protein F511_19402 [Dorcoceras hygrometricum]|uniref:Uncharacterized protein n=1 Tax=Dorcoceras hygrometricum TaxID=472368 RepID=A0A2Z7CZA6_9LAMI|nr:hypothetical protein F511_19402 [Dorcoceras hygrometricum]
MFPQQPDTQYSRNYQTQLPDASCPVASYPVASYPVATIQSQRAKPKAGRLLITGTKHNPRNAAFQLIQTTSHCSLDWFLKSTAGHPVATLKSWGLTKSNDAVTHASIAIRSCFIQSQHHSSRDWFFQSSIGHSLTSATTAFPFPPAASYTALSSRNTIPLATGSSNLRLVILSRAQQLLFHFHQLQATVTIKFQILPVVGYSTLHETQKPFDDKSGLGFNVEEGSSRETSTQSNLAYDKFKKRNFVKASVIHDTCDSVRYNDQITGQLNQKGKTGISYVRPENSKSSWLKNRLDKKKAKAGSKSFVQNQQRRGYKKDKSEWRKVQP